MNGTGGELGDKHLRSFPWLNQLSPYPHVYVLLNGTKRDRQRITMTPKKVRPILFVYPF